MTQSASVTKLSFVRGIGQRLQQSGVIKFASCDDLRYACDKVASVMQTEPVEITGNGTFDFFAPSDAEVTKVAQTLISVSDAVAAQGKTASYPASITLDTPEAAYGDLIRKLASSHMVGDPGNGENNMAAAAAVSNEGAQEAKNRPDGYANVGQGNTNFSEEQASRIGTERPHPDQDVSNGAATNSIVQATKAGSIASILSKLGMPMPEGGPAAAPMAPASTGGPTGATITGSDPNQQNAPENSTSSETIMDNMERPEGYANVGQGATNMRENAEAHIGTEQPHPKQPTDAEGAATNSVIEATKGASLRIIADELMPSLPSHMSAEEKIAAVRYCASLTPALRPHYIRELVGG